MRTLITGGAGFIGSHLAESLACDGHEVTIVDNFSTGRWENLSSLLHYKGFALYDGSAADEKVMRTLLRDVECVYHLAAVVGVTHVLGSPLEMLQTNHGICRVVLQAAADYAIPVFIASSAEVYGKPEGSQLLREDDDSLFGPTTTPRWGYAMAKAMDEHLALAYYHERQLPVVIGRFFNTIGPRQVGNYGMVVPRFVKAALANEPIFIYGSGKQRRSFVSVKDVVRALRLLMHCPEATGQVFNIGNTEDIDISSLARDIVRLTGSSSSMEYVSYEEAYGPRFEDILSARPDLTKIKSYVDYAPEYSIQDMLQRIITKNGAPSSYQASAKRN